MRDTSDLATGRTHNSSDNSLTDCLLTQEEHVRVTGKLSDMLTSVCEYCHERLGQLLSTAASDRDKPQNDKDKPTIETSVNKQIDKETQNWNDKVHWLSEKATALQVCQLAAMVEGFTVTCERLCGKQCTALRSAFKVSFILPGFDSSNSLSKKKKKKLTILLSLRHKLPSLFSDSTPSVKRNLVFFSTRKGGDKPMFLRSFRI